jgi:AcrR family transcriptional regulator
MKDGDERATGAEARAGRQNGVGPAPRRRPKKRERTQLQLIEAAMRVFVEKGVSGAPVQAIASEAGLANGTFYNHFASKRELIAAVAAHLLDRLADQIAASSRGLEDPAEWVAVALRHFNEKARVDPVWGNVTVRLGATAGEASQRIAAHMTGDLEEGIRRGRFQVPSRQAAADVVLGAGLMGILSVSTGRADPEHGARIAAMVLRALGLPPDEADEIAHRPLPLLGEV